MKKKFWINCIKNFLVITIPTIVAIITVFTFFNNGIEMALQKLGMSGCILVCCICFGFTLIYEVNNMFKTTQVTESVRKNLDDLNNEAINNLFKTACLFIKFPNDTPQINIHLYSYQKRQNEEYLQKERRFGYESERLSVDYSLEQCRIEAKNIIMCKAFKKNCVVFENLPENHISTYDSDIKDYIDKDIKWVLSCPIWINNDINKKSGVIVIFGLKEIAKNDETIKIKILKNLCLELAKSVSEFL